MNGYKKYNKILQRIFIKFILLYTLFQLFTGCERFEYNNGLSGEWSLVLEDGIVLKLYDCENSPEHLFFKDSLVTFYSYPKYEILSKNKYTYSDGEGHIFRHPYNPDDSLTWNIYKFTMRHDSIIFAVPSRIYARYPCIN